MVVGEDAADPRAGGDRVRADADPPAGEIARRERAPGRVVDEVRVLEAAHDDRRQQDERLAVGLRDQEGHDRKLGEVELEVAHHPLERGGRRFHVGDLELDPRRAELAPAQRRGAGVLAEQRLEPDGLGGAHLRVLRYRVSGPQDNRDRRHATAGNPAARTIALPTTTTRLAPR